MSSTSPQKDPDKTHTETTHIQATRTPKAKDESPDQNQQSQCQLRRPQQSESKRKRERSHNGQFSEEPRTRSPDAAVNVASIYKPNQSDQIQCQVYPHEAKQEITTNHEVPIGWGIVSCSSWSFEEKSERMEKKFKSSEEYSQSQNLQNKIRPVRCRSSSRSAPRKSERMEEKYKSYQEYPSQSQQDHQNRIPTAPANANGPSQAGGSNPVQGNPPSPRGRRIKRFFCLKI